MRQPRIKGQGESFYHCVSRVVEGRPIFQTLEPGSAEAEYFVGLLHRLQRACCVEVLTYALMSNHFHILCRAPARRVLSDAQLLDCIEAGSGAQKRAQVARQLARCRAEAAQALREPYLQRLFDVSVFIKELKGRFAQWYNRRHERYGVLWAERFKSVLIEPGPALRAVAAYIDLNPLRAGLCQDPKDYRYCGYGVAVAANCPRAQQGLGQALGLASAVPWREVSREYRKLLFRTGVRASKAAVVINPEVARQVVEELNGQIPLGELLRCRIRYFTDGGILGSREFVQAQFARLRGLPIAWVTARAHRLRGVADPQFWVLRDLRRQPIG